MASNGDWGVLAEHDPDHADAWDTYSPLPEPDTNPVLDAFVARKGISIASLVRVGARLQSDRVLAFAYPGGIKYRDMESGARWNFPGSEFVALKIVRHSFEPSATVIVAEGETDGAWLSENFPVDVALMPAGARTVKPEYLAQLSEYQQVLVGLDNDEAGKAGAAKILDGVPHAQRFAPPADVKDWCELGPDRCPEIPPLPESTPSERIGSITFTDLTAAWDGKLPAPEIIVDDLLYSEGVHTISGHPDSGKSIMAMHIAWQVMHDGRHVVWLDYEQGARMTGQRFREMGVPRELVRERLHWAWYAQDAAAQLPLVADAYPGALVVIDSMSKALAVAGIGENENSEVLAYTVQLIQASKAHSLPVIVVDHVAKSDAGSDYARGAGTKHADEDVHWKVHKVNDFTRNQQGLVQLVRHKDREGYLRKNLWFKVGDGAGGLGVEPTEAPDLDLDGNSAVSI